MKTPQYRIVHETDSAVTIQDVGPWDQYPTVTNGVEEVVAQIHEYLNGRQLFYYDSESQLDIIQIKDGKFNGFAPGPKL